MTKRRILQALPGLVLLLAGAMAVPAAAEVDAQFQAQVEERMKALLNSAQSVAVARSPVDDIYEVTVDGRILYITADTRHVFAGNLLDMENRVNLTEEAQDRARAATIEALGEEQMVIYRADEEEHVVTVFTDTECPYCQRLHDAMEDYNERGITVRYLAFPREGPGSRGWNNLVGVWCADDRNAAMDRGMSGSRVSGECDGHPVEAHLNLAGSMGVRGTPTIITADGQVLPGFVPPARLDEALNGS